MTNTQNSSQPTYTVYTFAAGDQRVELGTMTRSQLREYRRTHAGIVADRIG